VLIVAFALAVAVLAAAVIAGIHAAPPPGEGPLIDH
jgi:hypothetical protein